MTRNKIVVVFSLFLLVALIILGVRWHQRTTFRNQMRPLVQDDLADFSQESSSTGSLIIDPAVTRREKRIAEIKLFKVGHYRHARNLIVQLMEAEDQYLLENELAYEDSVQLQTNGTQLKFAEAEVKIANNISREEWCSATQNLLSLVDASIDRVRIASFKPELIEYHRKNGIRAWNQAYGWLRWMGLDVDPHNPFSSLQRQAILPNDWKTWLASFEQWRSEIAKAMVSAKCDARK